MNRQRWLTAAGLVGLIATLTWLALRPASNVSERPHVAAPQSAVAPLTVEARTSSTSPPPVAAAPHVPAAIPTGPANRTRDRPKPLELVTYYGRTQAIDGQPVADITVEFWLQERPSAMVGSVVSDVAGLFSIELPVGMHWLKTLQTERWRAKRAHRLDPSNELVLTLEELGSLVTAFGRVTKPNGEPLAGVTVMQIQDIAHTESDEQGEYRLSYHISDQYDPYQIAFFLSEGKDTARHIEMIRHSQHVEGTVQLDAVLDVSSNAQVPLLVRVIDERGDPLSAVVSVRGKESGIVMTTADGRFEHWVEPGSVYSFEASVQPANGRVYHPKTVENVEVGPDGLELLIQLEPADHGALAGTVVDTASQPVVDYPLRLASRADSLISDQRTDQAGSFLIEGLAPGDHWLYFHQGGLHSWGIAIKSGQTTDIIVVADVGGQALMGRVVDAAGEPMAGVALTLSWSFPAEVTMFMSPSTAFQRQRKFPPTGYATSVSKRQTVTDTDGKFALFDLANVNYEVRLTIAHPERATRTPMQPEPATLKPGGEPIDIIAIDPRQRR